MFGEMNRLKEDRAALRRRMLHVLEVARGLDEVQSDKIVVAGYCFGGMCALDLARSGADIAAAASFHGLFDPPGLPPEKIGAKVVSHGRYVTFQMAEVVVPRQMFQDILRLIARLRAPPAPA